MHQSPAAARPTCSGYLVRTAHNGIEGTQRRSRPEGDREVLLANAGTESHAVVARTWRFISFQLMQARSLLARPVLQFRYPYQQFSHYRAVRRAPRRQHGLAAFNTIDAVRAAEFWLYFPNQRLQQGLQPYKVPEMYFFYPAAQEANYYINLDAVADFKFDAAAKQVSQFEPAVNKYRSDWQPADLAKAKEEMRRGALTVPCGNPKIRAACSFVPRKQKARSLPKVSAS